MVIHNKFGDVHCAVTGTTRGQHSCLTGTVFLFLFIFLSVSLLHRGSILNENLPLYMQIFLLELTLFRRVSSSRDQKGSHRSLMLIKWQPNIEVLGFYISLMFYELTFQKTGLYYSLDADLDVVWIPNYTEIEPTLVVPL